MTTQEEVIVLTEGKQYKLRNGLITTPLKSITYGGVYRFEGGFEEFEGKALTVGTWIQGGHYLLRDKKHMHDIIESI